MVVDGNGGTIQNTANGTNQTYHQGSHAVLFTNCTQCEIKNLAIKNLYINAGSSSSATDVAGAGNSGIEIDGASTGSYVHNNSISQVRTGVMIAPDPNMDASNTDVSFNTISDMGWGICVGGGDSGDTINNINIHDNNITNWTNWQFPTSTYHQDGIILFNYANSTAGLSANVYNNYIYGDLGVGSPTGFVYCADFSSCTVYNNLLVNTGHGIAGIMWLGQTSNKGKNYSVYNNTIVSNQNDICITLTMTGTATFENNVVTGCNVGIHDYGTLTTHVSVSNHNVWQNGSGSAPQMATGDSNFLSYTTWRGYGYDANSSTASPNLSANYMPQSGSPAIGLGADLAALNIQSLDQDRLMYPRPGTAGSSKPAGAAWDAGAFNYADLVAPTNVKVTVK